MSVTKPRFTLEFEKPIRELEDKIAALRASSESAGMDVTKEAVSMEAKLARPKNLSVFRVPTAASQALIALAQRSMQLQATVQEGVLTLSDSAHTVEIEPIRWK